MSGNPATPLDSTPPRQTALSASELTARQHVLLAAVFLLALALRLIYLWGQARNNPMYNQPIMDSAMHDEWARHIADGQGMGSRPFFRAPLYYYLLGLLYKIVGPNITAARIAGCIGGAATCYVVARLGTILAGFGPGLVAGLIAALYWPFIYFDCELLTVGLEVLLDVSLLYLLLRAARRDSALLFLAAGVAWGLSAITRPNVLACGLGIATWLWIAARGDGRPLRKWRDAVLLGLGLLVPILPVAIRNYVVGGEPVLIATNGGVNFYIGNNPQSDGFTAIVPGTRASWQGGYYDTHRIAQEELGRKLTESEVSDYWYSKAFEWIRANPRAWLILTLQKIRIFWGPVEMPNDNPIWFMARMSGISGIFWIGFPVVACLGIAGIATLLPQWRKWFLPIAFLIIYMSAVIAFFVCGRYRLPIVPVLIVAASAGLFRVWATVRASNFLLPRRYVTVGVFSAVGLMICSPKMSVFNATCDATGYYNLAAHFSEPDSGTEPRLPEGHRLLPGGPAAHAPGSPDDAQPRLAPRHGSPGRAAQWRRGSPACPGSRRSSRPARLAHPIHP